MKQSAARLKTVIDPSSAMDTGYRGNGKKFKNRVAPGIASAAEAIATLLTWSEN